MKILWKSIPEELRAGAGEIEAFLGYNNGAEVAVSTQKTDKGFRITKEGDEITIAYHTKADFFRAMSMLERMETETVIEQKPHFESLCLMRDMSRNSVMSVDGVKRLMCHLAVMGYNSMMLYTEDTYEIPEYPYFGHLRGRYTHAELKELDAYALSLGIELIPCIQTLAHMNALRQWRVFSSKFDIDDILLAEDESVYELIEAMLRTVTECFTSRRINIGMDEAHHLGRGRYVEHNGYKPKEEIMLRHLDNVVKLCDKHGLKPMMWSDMFFRMAFGGQYGVVDGEISKEVMDKVPPEVQLVYWDYYTDDRERDMFRHMLQAHKKFEKNDLLFAGGAWSWQSITPKNFFSLRCTAMQLDECIKAGVKEVIATAWGDDGGECSSFAILPALLQYAELDYADDSNENMNCRFKECFGVSFDDFMVIDAANCQPERAVPWRIKNPPVTEKYMLFSDVLNGIMDMHVDPVEHPKCYAAAAEQLAPLANMPQYGYLFRTQEALCRLMELKSAISCRIKAAYTADDKETLAKIANEDLPETSRRLEQYIAAVREQWYKENKPFGLETHEARLGGVKERLRSCKLRLDDYLAGKIDRIEELEQPTLPFCGTDDGVLRVPYVHSTWFSIFTAGVVSHDVTT